MMWNYWSNPFAFWGGWLRGIIFPLIIIDLVLKGIALWRSARRGEKWWFVALLILNTAGILPLIYLLLKPEKSKKK